MNKEYPKDYTGPKAGQSENVEWMAVRGIQAMRWILDGTWTYSDFDCYLTTRESTYYSLGEKHILSKLEKFHQEMTEHVDFRDNSD